MSVFTYYYDEMGGYDCMTGAFILEMDGENVAKFDLADFGQEPMDYTFKGVSEIKGLMDFIVRKLNS